jgi:hypothetical protein
MPIETGNPRPLKIIGLPVAGERDQPDILKSVDLPQSARHLIAVDARQTDVEKHKIWSECRGSFQCVMR